MNQGTLLTAVSPDTAATILLNAHYDCPERYVRALARELRKGTFAGSETVAESVVWAKLGALVEGAALASARLWGRR
jgi:hypothetical protein